MTRRKRWFKCADALLTEPWPRDVKLTLVLLQAHLNRRWARDGIPNREAGRAVLSSGALRDITGKAHFDAALAALQRVAEHVSLRVTAQGGFIAIDWPKFANFQEYGARSQGKPRRRLGAKSGPNRSETAPKPEVNPNETIPKKARNPAKNLKVTAPSRDEQMPPPTPTPTPDQSLRDTAAAAVQSAAPPARVREATSSRPSMAPGAGAHVACAGESPEPDPEERRPPRRVESPASEPAPAAPPRVASRSPARGDSGIRRATGTGGQLVARFPAPASAAAEASPPAERVFRLPRSITPREMMRREVVTEVHRAAAAAGCVSAGEAGELEVLALAITALSGDRVRNAPGMWTDLLRMPMAERGVEQLAEDQARRLLREWREGDQRSAREALERAAGPRRRGA